MGMRSVPCVGGPLDGQTKAWNGLWFEIRDGFADPIVEADYLAPGAEPRTWLVHRYTYSHKAMVWEYYMKGKL